MRVERLREALRQIEGLAFMRADHADIEREARDAIRSPIPAGAADMNEIELRAEIERLRAALRDIEIVTDPEGQPMDEPDPIGPLKRAWEIARTALEAKH